MIGFASQNLASRAPSRPDLVKQVLNKVRTDGHQHLPCADAEPPADGCIRGRTKIITMGFANDAFQFIRYEVGDTAIWMPEDRLCVDDILG